MPRSDYKITYINDTPLGVFVGVNFFEGDYETQNNPETGEPEQVYVRSNKVDEQTKNYPVGTTEAVIVEDLNNILDTMNYDPIPEQE